MNETSVMALAGVFQASALVRTAAVGERVDEDALRASIHSIFMIDADSVAAVYAGPDGLRLGLQTLVTQLEQGPHDAHTTRIAMSLLRLSRSLAARDDMLKRVHDGILAAQRQVDHFGEFHPTVLAALGDLYAQTLSTLRPRIMVAGDANVLQQPAQVERVRALLLAGIRSAVLWHQLGGRQWQLLLHRKQAALLARGMLSRIRIDTGDAT
ncbi:MAG: high frequency lysogenization protein HflD [Xanthomonadales bacterium]|nr:high frequency lysogenization protein HflD [Xanthomonadales bacterium]